MKQALMALLLMAGIAQAAPPPITYTIEADFQQTQSLPNQSFQQGAGVRLRYKLMSNGSYLSLAGLTGEWQGRSSATSTNYITQATATTVTNTTPNYFQFDLDYTATGTAVSNWVYSVIATESSTDYVMGEGRLDIQSSAWTGAGATITADSCVTKIIAGDNITLSPTNGIGDVTINASVPVTSLIAGTGISLSPTNGIGDVTISATSVATTNTLAEVLTAGNTSGANDILLSASGLDQSRRLGFIVNDGIAPPSTNYLDSIDDGVLRWNTDIVAMRDWVTGRGYITAPPANDVTTTNIAQNITTTNITASGTVTLATQGTSKLAFSNGDTYMHEGLADRIRVFCNSLWVYEISQYGLYLRDDKVQIFGGQNDYSMKYSNSGTEFLFESADVDGARTGGTVFSVQDGTNTVDFAGDLTLAGTLTQTGAGTNSFAGAVSASSFIVGTNSTTMSSRLIGGTNYITFTIGTNNFNLALE